VAWDEIENVNDCKNFFMVHLTGLTSEIFSGEVRKSGNINVIEDNNRMDSLRR
jgi:hypothetical protein